MKIYILFLLSFSLFSCSGGKGEGFAPSHDQASEAPPETPPLDPVTISPVTYTLAVNNTVSFSASGGDGTYTYSVFSGGGNVLSTTGFYTAPVSSGSAVVRVTDGQGNFADATVTIKAALKISPSTLTIVTNDSTTFSRTGGVSPFTYYVVSGVGSINPTTGLYSAGAVEGASVVRVTDSLGNMSDANVTVSNTLAISPATPVYVEVNGTLTFSATGGVAPYTFSCLSDSPTTGIGTPADGDYTAPGTAGSDTCTVTDSLSATSSATVTIYDTFTLSPLSVTMAVGTTQTFTATGGVGAKTFSLVSGSGSINATTGVYTAPAMATTAVIEVADSIGNTLQATIDVVSTLTIGPKNIFIPIGSKVSSYTATLGTSPYTYSVISGGGSIVAGTGVYTAASTAGTGVVRVTDNIGTTNDTNVYHVTPVDIQSNWGYHTCALYSSAQYSNYKLKCWGLNSSGQLGYGDTNSRGDATSEQGYGLPFVNVGTNRYVKKVSVGWYHTCAILDNDTVKCWGQNTYGQLGYGNTNNLGDAAGEMGDTLAAVSLGTGRTAKDIFAFAYHTCAILDNNDTKCWGRNNTGQLGKGHANNIGDGAGEMGDALTVTNLGTGRYALKLAATESTTCAILDNNTVKCWGLGQSGTYGGVGYTYYGELGLETSNKTWGDGAGEMGDTLPTVNIGVGVTAVDIAGGRLHYCVVTNTGGVKCWGRNNRGQLGYDSTTDKGITVGSMGAGIANVNLGTTATSVKLMREASCATLTGGTVKCWGRNAVGQLLKGNTTTLGDGAGEMAALTAVNVGTGRTVSKLAAGYQHACAILDNGYIKCWGGATNGALLNASTTSNLGDAGTEVGDSLPYVNH